MLFEANRSTPDVPPLREFRLKGFGGHLLTVRVHRMERVVNTAQHYTCRLGDPTDEEMDLQEQINVESSHLFDDPIQQPFFGIVCRFRVTGGVYVPQLTRQLRVFGLATVP